MSSMNYQNHKRVIYSDPSPYPEIKAEEQNPYYVQLLMDDYAGIISEFTAINQYLYHYFYFREIDKELGELLENVAIIEMLHMEILAELIIKLGGSPIIRGSHSTCSNYWNGSFIYYGIHLCDRLKADIDAEYKAVKVYKEHIKKIDDPHIKSILERIILDEMVHIKLFSDALEKYCRL
ncbi:MAG: ferritin-like domain-containing protein [Bacillota bacterium]